MFRTRQNVLYTVNVRPHAASAASDTLTLRHLQFLEKSATIFH